MDFEEFRAFLRITAEPTHTRPFNGNNSQDSPRSLAQHPPHTHSPVAKRRLTVTTTTTIIRTAAVAPNSLPLTMSISSSRKLTISQSGIHEQASSPKPYADAANTSSRPLHPPSPGSPQPDFSLTTKMTFDSYVDSLQTHGNHTGLRPRSASVSAGASHHLKLEIPPSKAYQLRQRQHRTHTRNRRPMSAPSSRKPAASKSKTAKGRPPARSVSVPTTRIMAAAEPKTVAFQSTTAPRPAPRPKSSPIYLSSTHTSQRSLGHKIHVHETESRASWMKKKVAAAPQVASRVKAADRLRKAQQYDKALEEVRACEGGFRGRRCRQRSNAVCRFLVAGRGCHCPEWQNR